MKYMANKIYHAPNIIKLMKHLCFNFYLHSLFHSMWILFAPKNYSTNSTLKRENYFSLTKLNYKNYKISISIVLSIVCYINLKFVYGTLFVGIHSKYKKFAKFGKLNLLIRKLLYFVPRVN